MSDHQNKQGFAPDAELEREIRRARKVTRAEATGRMAGPSAMKGEPPVTRLQQVAVEFQEYLDRHLVAAASVLSGVSLRHRSIRISCTAAQEITGWPRSKL
jgi:hypothetical protein